MMDPSETHNFENQWKKAFDEASETPPASLWAGIEARLDHDDNNRVVPLWWHSSKIWYAAASIIALLLVGGGIWYNGRSGSLQNSGKSQMAVKVQSANPEETGPTGSQAEKPVNEKAADEPLIASRPDATNDEQQKSSNQSEKETNAVAVDSRKSLNEKLEEAITCNAKTSDLKNNGYAAEEIKKNEDLPIPGSKSAVENKAPGVLERDVSERIAVKNVNPADVKEEVMNAQNNSVALELLTPVPYSDLDVFMQKRYVFFKSESKPEEELAETKKPKEYWAGIGMMPASFNPDVKIKSAPMAFASQLNSRQKSLTGTNKAGASYALQTQGGVRLSKHWSMELGVNYLKGNSKYEGGGYVLSAYTNASSNVLQNALDGLAASPGNDKSGNSFTNGALYIDVNKKVNNDYQYLQLPLQAGFTLNPDKKLSYSVLGGMMANFFLSNDLESASGEIITTTASDDVYRSMNWAATTGLRFNYKLSSKWKASLTGSYQKSISSGFKANQSLDSHPYLYGVAWGVRYSF